MLNSEFEMSNDEIATRFMLSRFYGPDATSRDLVLFVSFPEDKGGLASTWDWDEKKGSFDGSKDMLEIFEICKAISRGRYVAKK